MRKKRTKNDNKRTERGKRLTITTAEGRTGKPLTWECEREWETARKRRAHMKDVLWLNSIIFCERELYQPLSAFIRLLNPKRRTQKRKLERLKDVRGATWRSVAWVLVPNCLSRLIPHVNCPRYLPDISKMGILRNHSVSVASFPQTGCQSSIQVFLLQFWD